MLKTGNNFSISLKFILILLVVSAGGYFYWLCYSKPQIGTEDANIFMTYMENFSSGYGFIYNKGGEHVEGFTSMLWTLLGAGTMLITDKIEISLLVLSIFFTSLTLLLTSNLLNEILNKNNDSSKKKCFLFGIYFFLVGFLLSLVTMIGA